MMYIRVRQSAVVNAVALAILAIASAGAARASDHLDTSLLKEYRSAAARDVSVRLSANIAEIDVQGWSEPMVQVRLYWVGTGHAQVDFHTSKTDARLINIESITGIHGFPWFTPVRGHPRLELRIPSGARLTVTQSMGQLTVHNVHGDLVLDNLMGVIEIADGGESRYEVDARVKLGDVEACGTTSRRRILLGAVAQSKQPSGKNVLQARLGMGTIRLKCE